MTIWTWILVAIVVFVLYNAEKMPEIMDKVKKDVPNLVEAGKKVSKELTEKVQASSTERKTSKKQDSQKEKK